MSTTTDATKLLFSRDDAERKRLVDIGEFVRAERKARSARIARGIG